MMVNAPTMGDANPQQQGEEFVEKKEGNRDPDPKEIGREFVRQYYTMLAEHPKLLHRFYSNDSTFIHGENPAEVGQTNIQKKISQLNFENCRAKIRKVDACGSKSGGVVIQVIGILDFPAREQIPISSRRFMQTFYLAQQTQKNYYVHNDIFHYVDEVFTEEDDQIQPANQGQHQEKAEVRGSESSEMEQPPPRPQRIASQSLSNNSHPQGPPAHYSNGTHHHEDPKAQPRPPSESVYGPGQMPNRVQHPSGGVEKFEENSGPAIAQPPNAHPSPMAPSLDHAQPPVSVTNQDRQQRAPSESAQSTSGPQEAAERPAGQLSWADRAKVKHPYPPQGGPGMMTGQGQVQMPNHPAPQYPPQNNNTKPQSNAPLQGMEPGGMAGGATFGVGEQTGMGGSGGQQHEQQPHYSTGSLNRRRQEDKKELFVGNVPDGWDKNMLLNALKQHQVDGIEGVRIASTKNEGRMIAFITFSSNDSQQTFFHNVPVTDGKRSLTLIHQGHEVSVSIDEKKERVEMMGGRGRGGMSFQGGRGMYSNRGMGAVNRNGPQGGGGPRNHQMVGGGMRGGPDGGRGARRGGPGAGPTPRYQTGGQRQ